MAPRQKPPKILVSSLKNTVFPVWFFGPIFFRINITGIYNFSLIDNGYTMVAALAWLGGRGGKKGAPQDAKRSALAPEPSDKL
jgi:hypothetical protein